MTIHFIQPIVNDNSQVSDDYYYLGMSEAKLNQCRVGAPIIQQGERLLKQATGHPYWSLTDFAELSTLCHLKMV